MNPFLNKMNHLSAFWLKHHYCLPPNCLEKGIRLLATSTEIFRTKYSAHYLTKILNAFCQFESSIDRDNLQFPQKRKVLLRIFKSQDRKNSALGVALVIKVLGYTEFLTNDHLLRAILHILPGVVATPQTAYYYRDEISDLLFIYQEIEKKRGRGFSDADIGQLKKFLSEEIEESIESYSPSLFLVRNEEEIFRSIVQMGRELNRKKDIPQVTISFQEQTLKGLLRFSVVVVRIVTTRSPSLKQLSASLPQTIHFIPEMVSEIGTIDKEHTKQANIVTFEVESVFFARKNGAIDLREARSYIAKALELMIGEYRDYNGGLFSKQNKHLKEMQELLGDSNKLLIESLFYAFTPSLFQTFILPEAGKACASLFLEAKNCQLTPQKNTLFFKRSEANFSLIVIKTAREYIKNAVLKEVSNFSLPLHQFGYSTQCINGEYFLGLIYQYPTDFSIFDPIEAIFQRAEQPARIDRKFLRINFQEGDPISLSPHIGVDLRCRSLLKALFEGLTRIDPKGIPQFAAAKSVEILDDGKTFIFILRNLQWSNGEDLTAAQFERSWKRAILSTSMLRPDMFYVIKNAKLASKGFINSNEIGVKALDKYTLKVDLEYPAPYFLEMVAHPLYFPLYEELGEPYVFNGPFSLNVWNRDLSITLIKNPYYWDFENIKLDGIEISMIRDPYLAFQKYQEGNLDWIGGPFSGLPTSTIDEFKDQLQSVDTSGVAWLYCNLAHPLFSSSKIRRALSFSLDRKKICEKAIRNPRELKTQLPTSLSLLDPEEFYCSEQEASDLFNQGLHEIGSSAQAFGEMKLFHSHIPGQKELATEVKRQWEEAFGIKIERIEKSWNTFSHNLDNRLIHFGSCHRHPFYNDPMYFFQIFNDVKNIHNAFGWQSDTFSHCISEYQASSDKRFLKLAEKELIEQMPVIPIHAVSYHYLARKEVKGINFSQSGDVDFRWIYFEDIVD